MSCDVSDINMNSVGFNISSRNRSFYDASFYYFFCHFRMLRGESKKKILFSTFLSLFCCPYSFLFNFLQGASCPTYVFSAVRILSFLISCKVLPVDLVSFLLSVFFPF
jgi:hypothetical protein